MKNKSIEKLFNKVNKKSDDNNIWHSSLNLTNTYLTYHFKGTEHNLLKKKYAEHLFVMMLEYLSHSKNLNNTNFKTHVMENFIDDIRKSTYKYRKDIFYKWLNCIIEKKQDSDHLTQSLITFFHSSKDIKKVKEQLGLNYKTENSNDI